MIIAKWWKNASLMGKVWIALGVYFGLFYLSDLVLRSHDPHWLISAYGWGLVVAILALLTSGCLMIASEMDRHHYQQSDNRQALGAASTSVRIKRPARKTRSNGKRI